MEGRKDTEQKVKTHISYHLIHHQPPNKAEKRISFSTHPTHMCTCSTASQQGRSCSLALVRPSAPFGHCKLDQDGSRCFAFRACSASLGSEKAAESSSTDQRSAETSSRETTKSLLSTFKELQKEQRVCHNNTAGVVGMNVVAQ